MVKRTLHFSNPAHLSFSNAQLVIDIKGEQKITKTIPIEDIGVVIIEHPQITLSMSVLDALIKANVAVVSCDDHYMPSGMFLPLDGHNTQTERIRNQLNASEPLKKQLWQQTIKCKIENQAAVLEKLGIDGNRLKLLASKVLSGDSSNLEAQAAAYYWQQLYGSDFVRSRKMESPNAQLNYGYAILRSLVARALSASGMYPSVGIHHRNKYNAFCLADDIMEPYRPFVDWQVINMFDDTELETGLTKNQKIKLLSLPQLDISIQQLTRPLFHAVSITTASLYKCFDGEIRKVSYPIFK
jgi:CRISPR-associated protein Cas1